MNLSLKTIYVDFDNVLVNSEKCIVDLYNEDFRYYKNFKPVNWWEIDTWNFKECSCANTQYINTYFNQPRFFDRLEIMPWAERVIEELGQIYKIRIVTMGYSPNLKLKKEWLDAHFPYLKMIGVNMKKHKHKGHIDMSDGVLIDDRSDNLFSSNAKDKVCFGEISSWNNDWNGRRCSNWMDVRHLLL